MTGQDGTTGADPTAPAYLELLDVLRCPHCRSPFVPPTDSSPAELVCSSCGRAYPVRGGVPVLLVDEARVPDGTGEEPGRG